MSHLKLFAAAGILFSIGVVGVAGLSLNSGDTFSPGGHASGPVAQPGSFANSRELALVEGRVAEGNFSFLGQSSLQNSGGRLTNTDISYCRGISAQKTYPLQLAHALGALQSGLTTASGARQNTAGVRFVSFQDAGVISSAETSLQEAAPPEEKPSPDVSPDTEKSELLHPDRALEILLKNFREWLKDFQPARSIELDKMKLILPEEGKGGIIVELPLIEALDQQRLKQLEEDLREHLAKHPEAGQKLGVDPKQPQELIFKFESPLPPAPPQMPQRPTGISPEVTAEDFRKWLQDFEAARLLDLSKIEVILPEEGKRGYVVVLVLVLPLDREQLNKLEQDLREHLAKHPEAGQKLGVNPKQPQELSFDFKVPGPSEPEVPPPPIFEAPSPPETQKSVEIQPGVKPEVRPELKGPTQPEEKRDLYTQDASRKLAQGEPSTRQHQALPASLPMPLYFCQIPAVCGGPEAFCWWVMGPRRLLSWLFGWFRRPCWSSVCCCWSPVIELRECCQLAGTSRSSLVGGLPELLTRPGQLSRLLALSQAEQVLATVRSQKPTDQTGAILVSSRPTPEESRGRASLPPSALSSLPPGGRVYRYGPVGELFGRASSLFWARNYREALEILAAAVQLGPEDPRLWYYKGFAELALGQERAGEQSLAKAIYLHQTCTPEDQSEVATAISRVQGRFRLMLEEVRLRTALPASFKLPPHPTNSKSVPSLAETAAKLGTR